MAGAFRAPATKTHLFDRVMNPYLIHHPEGDFNPYETVGWARQPLHPTPGTPIRVGVRAARPTSAVSAEWESGSDHGSVPLRADDDVWAGELGVFNRNVRYRFVSEEETTEWFEAKMTRWERHRFTGVDTDDRTLRATAGPGQLSLTPDAAQIAWTVKTTRSHETTGLEAETGGWEARLVDGELWVVSELGTIRLPAVSYATDDTGKVVAVRLEWRLESEERLFGTGERYDSVDQRGRCPDIRVYEQYKSQSGRTYFPLPWLISSRGYGIRVDSNERVTFDLGHSRPDEATATVPAQAAAGTWYFGSPKQVVGAYTQDVGRPSPLPLWAYGPWMSSNEWDREATVREMVERTNSEQIPATVVVVEAWSDETTFYLFNDTEYEAVAGAGPIPAETMRHGGRWPDPKKLIDWLHDQDLKIVLWQIPVLKDAPGHAQHDTDVAHAETSGYCISTVDGATYRNRGWWFPNARIIDFTHPEAVEWWFTKRAYLVGEYGVDGFKTDGGEHLWGSDVVNHAGETGDAAANTYPTDYLGAYHWFLTEHGHDAPVTFSRAGFTGSQAYPAHWAGDEDSTWEAYRSSLTAGLSAALGGVAFWSWDLAGFSGPLPSSELYMRSTAMAAFCPIMQYHSEHNQHRKPVIDRTPWNVAEQTSEPAVLDTYRFYANLRMNLVPYLDTLGHEASETGLPLMRPLALGYPEDPEAVEVADQFLLGKDILVAPVLEPGSKSRSVYIPAGAWFDLWTGVGIDPGQHEIDTPLDSIPVFVRGGAAVPLWLGEELELGSNVGLPAPDTGRLVLMIFPGEASTLVRHPLSGETLTVAVSVADGQLAVASTGAGELDVWTRIIPASDHAPTTRRLRPAETLRIPLQ